MADRVLRWRWFRHPATQITRSVRADDIGMCRIYERWGWLEVPAPVGVPLDQMGGRRDD